MSNVDLSVVGMGLTSPTALSAREHAFFIAAESTLGGTRAFVDAEGAPLGILQAPWLDPRAPIRARLVALAERAVGDALDGVAAPLPALSCFAAPDETASADDHAAVESALAAAHPLAFHARLHGEGGAFAGLVTARQWLEAGHPLVALIAVDSYCSLPAARARAVAPSRWERVPPYLSEAAAALLVALPGREGDRRSLGHITFAGALQASASDLDDEPVDGAAMTSLLRAGARHAGARLTQSFGQHNVDALRLRSWSYAAVRNFDAIVPECRLVCLEDDIGRVGAAAGLAHLIYGLAVEVHGTAPMGAGGPFAAWAVSRSGLNGLCIARGGIGP